MARNQTNDKQHLHFGAAMGESHQLIIAGYETSKGVSKPRLAIQGNFRGRWSNTGFDLEQFDRLIANAQQLRQRLFEATAAWERDGHKAQQAPAELPGLEEAVQQVRSQPVQAAPAAPAAPAPQQDAVLAAITALTERLAALEGQGSKKAAKA